MQLGLSSHLQALTGQTGVVFAEHAHHVLNKDGAADHLKVNTEPVTSSDSHRWTDAASSVLPGIQLGCR